MTELHAGSCLCGGVAYEVRGPLRPIVACHCGQCRKTSGHYVAATAAERADFRLIREETLVWYTSSATAKRGFCGRCGSNLLWSPEGEPWMSICAGTLDTPTNLPFETHIYVKDKADYVTLPEGAEIFDQGM